MAPWLRAPTSSRLRLAFACVAVAGIVFLAVPGRERAALAPAIAPAAASSGELVPSERHRRVMRLVSEVVDRQHYRQAALDDSMSSQIFERYLEALDGNRSYLLASDIAEFEPLRYQLDDAIEKADAGPAFRIFTRFQERNREVLRHAIALLDVEPDFTLDESFRFDRTDDGWPASVDELHELWRKRVKNDALSLVLAGKTWPEASDVLRKRYERVGKRIEQITADDVFETFMNAYSHVYDPHSNYLSPRNSEEYNIAMSLSYEGIGASLQLVDDYVTIMNVLPGGSAAASADLKVGDRITAVGQGEAGALTDVVGWRLDDVVQLIRGPESTWCGCRSCRPRPRRARRNPQLTLKRSKITLESQAAKKELHTIERGDRELRVGVISVPSFYQDFQARMKGDPDYRSTTRDVHRLVDELQGGGHRLAGHRPARQRRRPPVGGDEPRRACSSSAGRSCSCARPAAASRCWTTRSPASPGTARWSCWSTARAPRRRRSSPARSRTTTAASSSASRPTARARCRTSTRSTATRSARRPASAS